MNLGLVHTLPDEVNIWYFGHLCQCSDGDDFWTTPGIYANPYCPFYPVTIQEPGIDYSAIGVSRRDP